MSERLLFLGSRKDAHKDLPKNSYLVVAPRTSKISEADLKTIEKFKPTHILALSEKTVVTAALLRERLKLPGTKLETAQLCHDKVRMKKKAKELGVAITPYAVLEAPEDLIAWQKQGHVSVLKNTTESGGRGTTYHANAKKIPWQDAENKIIEKHIQGYEVSVECFVQNGKILFSNLTLYLRKYMQNLLPAPLDKVLQNKILKLNEKIIHGFQIEQGMTHAEFYVTETDILFGEIALRPPGGYILRLIDLAYGISAWQAFRAAETGAAFDFPKGAKAFAAVHIWHPGPGKVKKVEGKIYIEELSNLESFRLKIAEGDVISEREGAGQDVGYAIFSDPDIDELQNSLKICEKKLRIQIR